MNIYFLEGDKVILQKNQSKTPLPVLSLPVTLLNNVIYTLVKTTTVSLVTSHSKDINLLPLLTLVVDSMDHYFTLDPQGIRRHFDLVYQILDELVGNCHALQSTTSLLSLISPPSSLLASLSISSYSNLINSYSHSPNYSVGNDKKPGVAWRDPQSYTTNEVFFDIIETIDQISSRDGVISGFVNGKIQTTCRLSGMPDLLLRLGGFAGLQPMFHQCVRYRKVN